MFKTNAAMPALSYLEKTRVHQPRFHVPKGFFGTTGFIVQSLCLMSHAAETGKKP
jgi:hypothetical protein